MWIHRSAPNPIELCTKGSWINSVRISLLHRSDRWANMRDTELDAVFSNAAHRLYLAVSKIHEPPFIVSTENKWEFYLSAAKIARQALQPRQCTELVVLIVILDMAAPVINQSGEVSHLNAIWKINHLTSGSQKGQALNPDMTPRHNTAQDIIVLNWYILVKAEFRLSCSSCWWLTLWKESECTVEMLLRKQCCVFLCFCFLADPCGSKVLIKSSFDCIRYFQSTWMMPLISCGSDLGSQTGEMTVLFVFPSSPCKNAWKTCLFTQQTHTQTLCHVFVEERHANRRIRV